MSGTREVTVEVTQEMIDAAQALPADGSTSRSKTCAVARGITAALGYPCSCGPVSVYTEGPVTVVGALPEVATRFIIAADSQWGRAPRDTDEVLVPFSFTLTVRDEPEYQDA